MSEKTTNTFKEARLKQGLTQVELAEKAGMHPNSYAKILSLLSNITISVMVNN